MARTTIGLNHFDGGRNVTPSSDDGEDDLAKLLREQQQDVKAVNHNVAFADTPYDMLETEVIVGVDTTGGAVTVNLPLAASMPAGKMYIVQDVANNAATNNITIAKTGADTLVGVSAIVADDGRATVYSDGVDTWYSA